MEYSVHTAKLNWLLINKTLKKDKHQHIMFQLDNTKKYKMEADFSSSFYDTRGQGKKKKEDTEQNF